MGAELQEPDNPALTAPFYRSADAMIPGERLLSANGLSQPAPSYARGGSGMLSPVMVDRVAGDRLGDLHARAAALTGVGAWECDLATGGLRWTPEVFALFGLPVGARLDRRATVAMYSDESRSAMERLRADAIARRGGFTLDAEIVGADRRRRWMRITAGTLVRHGRATRLYGTKQDVTDERRRWDALRRLSEEDALTGLANRRAFQSQFLDGIHSPRPVAPLGALVLFDVDGFKRINDRWGHAAGDACLRQVAIRLARGFADAQLVARIGGDEFAVLLPAGRSVEAIHGAVRAQLAHITAPILWQDELLEVGASAGLAIAESVFDHDAEAMFAAADAALYDAKRRGGRTLRTAPRAPTAT